MLVKKMVRSIKGPWSKGGGRSTPSYEINRQELNCMLETNPGGRVGGWVDGWVDGWMGGWMGGWFCKEI